MKLLLQCLQTDANLVSTLHVDLDDQIPILILHILKADVSQDPRIIDKDIDPPERLNGRLDNSLAILDTVVVCDRLAARGFDLIDDYIGGLDACSALRRI